MSKLDQILADIQQDRIRGIKLMGKSFNEYQLHCPYCGSEQNMDDQFLEPGEDWETRECENCQMAFRAKASLRFSSGKL